MVMYSKLLQQLNSRTLLILSLGAIRNSTSTNTRGTKSDEEDLPFMIIAIYEKCTFLRDVCMNTLVLQQMKKNHAFLLSVTFCRVPKQRFILKVPENGIGIRTWMGIP